MTQFIFLEAKTGSHNGVDIVEHQKGDLIQEAHLSVYLKDAWLEQGALKEVVDCNEDCYNCDETDCLNKADDADENPIVAEAKEIINAEAQTPEMIGRLKEIGIALEVENIEKCSNPETIIKKVSNALEEIVEEV